MDKSIQKSYISAKAIASALTGFLFLAFVSVLIKLEENASASIEWIVFIQYLTCLTTITFISSKTKFRSLRTKHLKYHIIRGVTGVLAFTFYVIAITKIPLVNAALLNNSTPLFIPVITMLWLKKRTDKNIWWGISTGLIGIVIILKPSVSLLLKPGDLFGLASGIILAISYVALRILTKTESFATIIFYYSLIASILSFPFALNNWTNPPLLIWIYGILSGVFFMSYLFLLQYSYRFIEPVKLAPFNYTVIVFSGVLDWILFNYTPDLSTIIGIILVSAGGILAITLHERDNKKESSFNKTITVSDTC